jgi:hypothetical protein
MMTAPLRKGLANGLAAVREIVSTIGEAEHNAYVVPRFSGFVALA